MPNQLPTWTVEFYTDARGHSPIAELIAGLPANEHAVVIRHLQWLQEWGIAFSGAKPLAGHSPLWELTPGAMRVIYFLHTGRRFIVLHVFRKKTRKTPRREIATAEYRLAEFLGRNV